MHDYNERLLIDYLPTVLQQVREYQVITSAEQIEIVKLFEEIQTALDNQFITTLTEYGVLRWEKILNIIPKATYTLEERKFEILTRLTKQLPYTIRMLKQILADLCGEDNFSVSLDANAYELKVGLALTSNANINSTTQMLQAVIPANLVISIELMFITYDSLRAYTHQQLQPYTHHAIRNGEM